ncbi:hypothetical protein L6Q21_12580 [Sandaracinobacter sp. RS1-74]|uniref:hypothetical protein n=1 Tax=Sandaracinobacteroides sayramensis TaxID=2913411 RepID=UPI001EDB0247|nr:hypothetical protein [Sandaracinobacteroides sayramensis]MCG2841818.1 hypothetical protein [Sandaracinobacteroides sayramensis]
MSIFAFYPAASHLRRTDGIGFIMAEGADEAAARAVAQQLVGGQSIDGFAAVQVGAGVDAVAVQGMPVGARNRDTWPKVTRGGGFLGAAA